MLEKSLISITPIFPQHVSFNYGDEQGWVRSEFTSSKPVRDRRPRPHQVFFSRLAFMSRAKLQRTKVNGRTTMRSVSHPLADLMPETTHGLPQHILDSAEDQTTRLILRRWAPFPSDLHKILQSGAGRLDDARPNARA